MKNDEINWNWVQDRLMDMVQMPTYSNWRNSIDVVPQVYRMYPGLEDAIKDVMEAQLRVRMFASTIYDDSLPPELIKQLGDIDEE